MSSRQSLFKKSSLLMCCCLVLLLHIILTADGQTFMDDPQKPEPRWGHTLNSCDDGALLFGGENQYGEKMNDLWHLDCHGTWSQIQPINSPPPARSGHTAGYTSGTYYVLAGEGDEGLLDDVWTFNLGGAVWNQETPTGGTIPEARKWASSGVYEGDLYLYGGKNASGENLMDSWKYDFTDNSWTHWLTHSPSSGQSLFWWQDAFYAFGGMRWSDTDFRDDLRYADPNDPYATDFTHQYIGGFPPSARAFHGSAVYGNDSWIFGGIGPGAGPYIQIFWDGYHIQKSGRDLYSEAINSPSGEPLTYYKMIYTGPPEGSKGLGQVEASGVIYLFGGKDAEGNATDAFYQFDPEAGTWEDLTSVMHADSRLPSEFDLAAYPNPLMQIPHWSSICLRPHSSDYRFSV